MFPLGKNLGRYQGETIDIQKVLREVEENAAGKNWTRDAGELTAYRRTVARARTRLYISTGIHGDEPAGALAGLQLVREDQWPADAAIWLCPCLNPTGFPLNRRENAGGVDLNRDYRHPQSAEVRAHVEWLRAQPDFDLALCLHEDWEARGFYLYELNPDHRPSAAKHIIDKVAEVCPIDPSPVIENWPAENGVLRPAITPEEHPQWPESLYLVSQKKAPMSYTMEAPSDFPMEIRVNALVTAVRAALAWL